MKEGKVKLANKLLKSNRACHISFAEGVRGEALPSLFSTGTG